MLNPFPQLLTYGFFAPTLLRLVAASVILFIAWDVWRGARQLAAISFPIVGKTKPWLLQLASGITLLVGLALAFGYDTQWAAILGLLIGLKLMYFRKKVGAVITLEASTYLLLIAICCSLLLSGAGALAFDLPL